jgi:hypothetical protein
MINLNIAHLMALAVSIPPDNSQTIIWATLESNLWYCFSKSAGTISMGV